MQVNVGIIGVGTVGSGTIEILEQQKVFFKEKLGLDIKIHSICAKTQEEFTPFNLPAVNKTTNAGDLCTNPDIDIIVEVAGGYEMPKEWILCALKHKKHIVTANKALLAKYGSLLFPLAAENNCALMFEAAVGGGIPVIRSLQETLVGNDIEGLACIINGTCNYILTQMTEKHAEFSDVLKEAQNLGYAETDPTFDIEGIDSAHKVALLASLSYGKYVDFEKMYVEGITKISQLDVEMAQSLGYAIKLLGIVGPGQGDEITASVYPALIHRQHQLASVNGVINAVYIKNSFAGPILLTGAGAGKLPTASSIVGDIVSIARQMQSSEQHPISLSFINKDNVQPLQSIDKLQTEYYIRIMAKDEPGVLARATTILAEHHISIKSIVQKGAEESELVPIIILTHKCSDKNIREALEKIDLLEVVSAPSNKLRFYS
jgi:homoserine dehydrogenase